MNTSYLALLRGVNVGGKNMLKMAELAAALAKTIEESIFRNFRLKVSVAVFSKAEWQAVIANSPKSWGQDTAYSTDQYRSNYSVAPPAENWPVSPYTST